MTQIFFMGGLDSEPVNDSEPPSDAPNNGFGGGEIDDEELVT